MYDEKTFVVNALQQNIQEKRKNNNVTNAFGYPNELVCANWYDFCQSIFNSVGINVIPEVNKMPLSLENEGKIVGSITASEFYTFGYFKINEQTAFASFSTATGNLSMFYDKEYGLTSAVSTNIHAKGLENSYSEVLHYSKESLENYEKISQSRISINTFKDIYKLMWLSNNNNSILTWGGFAKDEQKNFIDLESCGILPDKKETIRTEEMNSIFLNQCGLGNVSKGVK